MSTGKYFFFVGLFLCYALSGCIGCAPEFEDTSIDRKWVDSTYLKQKVVISLEVDSLCDLRREKFIKNAVDSILGERLAEMREQQ